MSEPPAVFIAPAVVVARAAAEAARAVAAAEIANVRLFLVACLCERRMALGVSQAAVADAAGLSRASIANLEAGRQLSVESLIGYASAVGLSLCSSPPTPLTAQRGSRERRIHQDHCAAGQRSA